MWSCAGHGRSRTAQHEPVREEGAYGAFAGQGQATRDDTPHHTLGESSSPPSPTACGAASPGNGVQAINSISSFGSGGGSRGVAWYSAALFAVTTDKHRDSSTRRFSRGSATGCVVNWAPLVWFSVRAEAARQRGVRIPEPKAQPRLPPPGSSGSPGSPIRNRRARASEVRCGNRSIQLWLWGPVRRLSLESTDWPCQGGDARRLPRALRHLVVADGDVDVLVLVLTRLPFTHRRASPAARGAASCGSGRHLTGAEGARQGRVRGRRLPLAQSTLHHAEPGLRVG